NLDDGQGCDGVGGAADGMEEAGLVLQAVVDRLADRVRAPVGGPVPEVAGVGQEAFGGGEVPVGVIEFAVPVGAPVLVGLAGRGVRMGGVPLVGVDLGLLGLGLHVVDALLRPVDGGLRLAGVGQRRAGLAL